MAFVFINKTPTALHISHCKYTVDEEILFAETSLMRN